MIESYGRDDQPERGERGDARSRADDRSELAAQDAAKAKVMLLLVIGWSLGTVVLRAIDMGLGGRHCRMSMCVRRERPEQQCVQDQREGRKQRDGPLQMVWSNPHAESVQLPYQYGTPS